MATNVRKGMIFRFNSSRSMNSDKTNPKLCGPNGTYIDCRTLCGERPHIVISNESTGIEICTIAPIRSNLPTHLRYGLPQIANLPNHDGPSYVDIANMVTINSEEIEMSSIVGFATRDEMISIERLIVQYFAPSVYKDIRSDRLHRDMLSVDYVIETLSDVLRSSTLEVEKLDLFITKMTALRALLSNGRSSIITEPQQGLCVPEYESIELSETSTVPSITISAEVVNKEEENNQDHASNLRWTWTTERYLELVEYCAKYGIEKARDRYKLSNNSAKTTLYQACKVLREELGLDYGVSRDICPVHRNLKEGDRRTQYINDHKFFERHLLTESKFLNEYDLKSAWQAKYQRAYVDKTYKINN